MCRTLIQLSELRERFPEVLFLHGITRGGAESLRVWGKTFAERIVYGIDESTRTKLSTHSFAFGINDDRHLWGHAGIILREGDVIEAKPHDTGLTKQTLDQVESETDPDFHEILMDPDRNEYNELLVQYANAVGIYIRAYDDQFTPEDILAASLSQKLPVFFLADQGLFGTEWNAEGHTFDFLPNDPVNLENLFT